jgi:hypothetical protein
MVDVAKEGHFAAGPFERGRIGGDPKIDEFQDPLDAITASHNDHLLLTARNQGAHDGHPELRTSCVKD